MKIKKITDDCILFTNGETIAYDHPQDCCEHNYADFCQLDDLSRNTDFSSPLSFSYSGGNGFRFGNKGKMFYVPCYSEQNGYYSADVDIYYNGELKLSLQCEERYR